LGYTYTDLKKMTNVVSSEFTPT
jgi:hypothetical protein